MKVGFQPADHGGSTGTRTARSSMVLGLGPPWSVCPRALWRCGCTRGSPGKAERTRDGEREELRGRSQAADCLCSPGCLFGGERCGLEQEPRAESHCLLASSTTSRRRAGGAAEEASRVGWPGRLVRRVVRTHGLNHLPTAKQNKNTNKNTIPRV